MPPTLLARADEKVAQNVAAGVAGLVVWPLWFAMDFKAQPTRMWSRCKPANNI